MPREVERTRAVLDRLGPLLRRYHGGMPVGFLAAIATFESGGKMSSRGDATLGEVGIFQITRTFPPKVGLSADSRFDEETNVFLGCIEYQIEALQMHLAAPAISMATADNWKLARLAFAIGSGGTKKLLEKSGARSYKQLVDFMDQTGGVPLGRQSAGKVWFRVKIIDVLWDIGMIAQPPAFIGAPVKIPNPPVGAYTLPRGIDLPSPMRGPLIAAGIGVAALTSATWLKRLKG